MKGLLLWIEVALFSVGALLLGYVGYVWADARLLRARADVEIHERNIGVDTAADKREGTLLGEIEIPRIGLSSAILEGTDAPTLLRAAGHIRGTALPGQAGNLCIAGHRDTFFRPLRRIAAGDEIRVRTPGGDFAYRVQTVEVVRPEDTQVLKRSTHDTITLVTCYPFKFIGSAPDRFIVRGVRIS